MIPGVTALSETALSTLPEGVSVAEAPLFRRIRSDFEISKIFLLIARPVNSSNVEQTLYLSNTGFISAADDSPANTLFEPRLVSPFNFNTKLFTSNTLSGKVNTGAGDITIDNGDGDLDDVLAHIFNGHEIEVLMGAEGFSLSDFGTIFKGVAEQITWNESHINIRLRDRIAALNVPIQDNLYGGTGGADGTADLKGKPKPLCYGVCYEISPVLVNPSTSLYQIHDGAIQAVDAVYFAGAVATLGVDYTVDAANGTITLLSSPNGIVTCDVRGDASGTGYIDQAADIIQRIAEDKLGFTSADIDLQSFSDVNAVKNGAVGIYIKDTSTVSSAFDILANTINCWYGFNRTDELRVGVIAGPTSPVKSLDATQIRSIVREATPTPNFRTKVGYKKVWTPQNRSQLAGTVSESRISYLGEEYRYAVAEDSGVSDKWLLSEEKVVNALYDLEADASTEATSQQSLFGTPRDIYRVDLKNLSFDFELGDSVDITWNRFGLESGQRFVIIGISENVKQDSGTLLVWG